MSLINPPAFLGSAVHSYPAARLRRVHQTLCGGRTGPVETTAFTVAATTPASMSVEVAPGRAWVPGEDVLRQGVYLVENTATTPVGPFASAHATLNRIDLIVLRVYDAAPDGGSSPLDEARLEIVQGTPAATPTPPSTPQSSIPIATVRVNAGSVSIAQAAITDMRWGGAAGVNTHPILNAAANTAQTMTPGPLWVKWPVINTQTDVTISPASTVITVHRPGVWFINPSLYVYRVSGHSGTGRATMRLRRSEPGGQAFAQTHNHIPPNQVSCMLDLAAAVYLPSRAQFAVETQWEDTAGSQGEISGSQDNGAMLTRITMTLISGA